MGATVIGLLEKVRRLGIEIAVVEGVLSVRPPGRLPAKLREQLRVHKPAIVKVLSTSPAASPLIWQPTPPEECRHCGGGGKCPCPACTLRRTGRPVPCLICRPMERRVWLAATRQETCWHCDGSGKCKCISCGQHTAFMVWGPGPCLSCLGRKRHPAQ